MKHADLTGDFLVLEYFAEKNWTADSVVNLGL